MSGAHAVMGLALAALALAIGMSQAYEALLGVVLVQGRISRRLHTDELPQPVVAVAAQSQFAQARVVALHAANERLAGSVVL
ncbi:MAG: hypothetical protein NTZ05_14920 [Chloroflexi bacterium]|nr:hypothetical protein [Chloroflexota bacterium]